MNNDTKNTSGRLSISHLLTQLTSILRASRQLNIYHLQMMIQNETNITIYMKTLKLSHFKFIGRKKQKHGGFLLNKLICLNPAQERVEQL